MNAQEGNDAVHLGLLGPRIRASSPTGELPPRRGTQICEPVFDLERVPAVRTTKYSGTHPAIEEFVGQEDQSERWPAPRAGQSIGEKKVHVAGQPRSTAT